MVWQDLDIDVDEPLQTGPRWGHCVNGQKIEQKRSGKHTRILRVEEQRIVERKLSPVEIHSFMDGAESKRESEVTRKIR
jgi:hypothetical protein